MDPKYSTWIKEHFPTSSSAYGSCVTATAHMVRVFPELTRVRGYYLCHQWGSRTHWWCETLTGEIVDPTVHQFPTRDGAYQPYREGDPLPTGVCMNCAVRVFDNATFCCKQCAEDFVKSCTGQ